MFGVEDIVEMEKVLMKSFGSFDLGFVEWGR